MQKGKNKNRRMAIPGCLLLGGVFALVIGAATFGCFMLFQFLFTTFDAPNSTIDNMFIAWRDNDAAAVHDYLAAGVSFREQIGNPVGDTPYPQNWSFNQFQIRNNHARIAGSVSFSDGTEQTVGIWLTHFSDEDIRRNELPQLDNNWRITRITIGYAEQYDDFDSDF